jgi:hypothetical protein
MSKNHEATDWYSDGAESETINFIPVRVRGGSADKETLTLNTLNSDEVINWEDVELICLGVIRYAKKEKIPDSQIRKMVRGLLFGEENTPEPEEYTVTQFLDIYVRNCQAPFRIDKDNINYKSFLMTASYVSSQNFEPLVKRIVFFAKSARLNPSLFAYLAGKKEKIYKYKSSYEFQEDCEKNRKNLENLPSRSDVEIFP